MARKKRITRRKLQAIMRNLRKAWAATRGKRRTRRKRKI